MVTDFSSHSCFPQDVNLILSLSQSLLIIVMAYQSNFNSHSQLYIFSEIRYDCSVDENLVQNAIHFHFLFLFLS